MSKTALFPLVALLACGGPVVPELEPEEVESLELVAQGDEWMTGRPIPILVHATDSRGEPVAGALVSMRIVEGTGGLRSTSSNVQIHSLGGAPGRGARATMGADGSAELELVPIGAGALSLQALVSNQAGVGDRLDFHVGLSIVLDYSIGEWGYIWGLEPGFNGWRRVPSGTPVEWVCECESDWGVVGTRESTGEMVFESGTLGPDDVFRWVPGQEGGYEYWDPVGGARSELTVTPALILP